MRPTPDAPPGYRALALRTPTLPPVAHTNCYVIGHEGALVVDPGSPHPPEQELLASPLYRLLGEGGELAGVLLTHHHGDHVAGAAAVARTFDLPLYAHRLTFDRLPGFPGLERLERRTLEDGDVLRVDGHRELEVLHTPGHAVGHLCLLERTPGPAQGTLLAGDMVPGVGTTLIDPAEGDMRLYLESLRRLADLDPARVLPAHGPMLPGRPAIEALIAHREAREAQVLAALAPEGRPAAEIARQAYAELPPSLLGLALRSTLAHLHKLRGDGRARSDDGGERWRLAAPAEAPRAGKAGE